MHSIEREVNHESKIPSLPSTKITTTNRRREERGRREPEELCTESVRVCERLRLRERERERERERQTDRKIVI
jgi:predicted DNA-binding protein (UPF0278 family)